MEKQLETEMEQNQAPKKQPYSSSSTRPATGQQDDIQIQEQALWRQLNQAESIESYTQAWLSLLCQMIDNTQQGTVVLRLSEDQQFTPIAFWPTGQENTSELTASAELVLQQKRATIRKLDDGKGKLSAVLAYPVLIDTQIYGVAAIHISAQITSELTQSMRQLQWAVAWLRDRQRKKIVLSQQEVVTRTTMALDILSIVLEQEWFNDACRLAATELASQTECERVSIGFLKNGHTAVATVSHSAEFGKQMNLLQMLGAAMDEAIDQRAILRFPENEHDDPMVLRAHEELAHSHGAGIILTIPLLLNEHYIGAITYERPDDNPFEQQTIELLTGVTSVLSPVLDNKRLNDRWLIVKVAESFSSQIRRLLGPGYVIRKLITAAAVILISLAYLINTEYRITADARIEGKIQRSLIAPFDGYIRIAPVRAGETIKQGTLLAALDDRELALARLKHVTERAQNQHRFKEALSARDRSETNIIKTEIQQADAQIALIDQQLARARVIAPFTGIVVAGDLSQNIDGAVRRGDSLFEMAPLNEYRVILNVDEAQITDIRVGQQGELLTTSLPDTPFPLVVTHITPVAESLDGHNLFQVEAELSESSARLRPGMEGVGKIDIGQRKLVWVWSRSLIDWFKLWIWRWFA